jgi:AraC-like DNA-binding protein
LSDALGSLGLRSRVFCWSELSASWALDAPAGDFAHFHLVTDGDAWLHLPSRAVPLRLTNGDLVVLPRGTGHVLSDSRDRPVDPSASLADIKRQGGLTLIRNDGRGPITRVICGSFSARHQEGSWLLTQLPDVLSVKGRNRATVPWLAGIVDLFWQEARHPGLGRGAVMTRLTDILLIRVLRQWLERSPNQRGWLVALRDRHIGAALSLIHRRLDRAWTVDELAKHVAMSRSAFADRFAKLVGEPPLRYIARTRMNRAAELLRTTSLPVEHIGTERGYATTAAFSKAFKRQFGVAPGAYRKR